MKTGLYSILSVLFIYLLFFIYRILFWDITEDSKLILLNSLADTMCSVLVFLSGNRLTGMIQLKNPVIFRIANFAVIALLIHVFSRLLIQLHHLVYTFTGSMDESFSVTFSKFTFQIFDSYVPVFIGYSTLLSAASYDRYLEIKKNKEQIERNFLKVQNDLLKSQIGPHFLFNTLNNIYHMIQDENDDAKSCLLKLADLLRFQIYNAKTDFIDFSIEYTYLMNYISLQKIRMEKDFHLSVNNQIESDFKIAPLLLVNLVENAFKYCGKSSGSYIKLDFATAKEDRFIFKIRNSISCENNEGAGHAGGFGLDNLTKRLNLIYPSNHTFDINQSKDHFYACLTLNTNNP